MLWTGAFIWNNSQANISLCFFINNVFYWSLGVGNFDKTLLSWKLSENVVFILFVFVFVLRESEKNGLCECVNVFRQFDKYIIVLPPFNLDFSPVKTETFVTFAMLDNLTHGEKQL